jgi:hypothetical protein
MLLIAGGLLFGSYIETIVTAETRELRIFSPADHFADCRHTVNSGQACMLFARANS